LLYINNPQGEIHDNWNIFSYDKARKKYVLRQFYAEDITNTYSADSSEINVMVLFPLELKFHFIAKSAVALEKVFSGAGGLKMFNPLKVITNPVIAFIDEIFRHLALAHIMLMIFSLVLLFASLFS
jgi:hypothetical protein